MNTAPLLQNASTLQRDIVKTLLYFDIFQHPLRLTEIREFLPSNSVTVDDIQNACSTEPLNNFITEKNGLVCLEKGKNVRPVGVGNHWGLDLASREEVDRAHELAIAHKEKYGIQKVMKITDMHGTYAFYFQDRDGNWWEFQYSGDGQERGEGRYDKHFARGDIA